MDKTKFQSLKKKIEFFGYILVKLQCSQRNPKNQKEQGESDFFKWNKKEAKNMVTFTS
jgi:hypothetical protein